MNSCSSSVIKLSLKNFFPLVTHKHRMREYPELEGILEDHWNPTPGQEPAQDHPKDHTMCLRAQKNPNNITKLESNWSLCRPSKATFNYRTVIKAHFLQILIHYVQGIKTALLWTSGIVISVCQGTAATHLYSNQSMIRKPKLQSG